MRGSGNSPLKPLAEQLWVTCQLDPSTAGVPKDTAEGGLGRSQGEEADVMGRDKTVKELHPAQAGSGIIQ